MEVIENIDKNLFYANYEYNFPVLRILTNLYKKNQGLMTNLY